MSIKCQRCSTENIDRAAFCGSCGSFLVSIKGNLLDGRYELVKTLKKGGMGCVYQAKDINLGIDCAVKEMLSSDKSADQEYAIKRFKEEALLLGRLRHPNLPVVRDCFIENKKYYLVMDYIDGEDMQTTLIRLQGKPLPEREVIRHTIQILGILDYLHSQSPPVIYRDLKPGNIMIRKRDRRAMLVDFGIARTVQPESSTTKTTIGTFGYCAVEQVKGKPEIRSDIYSMGATMYHMLTGVQPQFMFIEPILKINPGISKKTALIVTKAIQLKPQKRFSSAREMIEALKAKELSPELKAEENPDMVYVPAGEFWMGSNDSQSNEYPMHRVSVKDFLIDKHPVTNGQFDKFVRETGAKIHHWRTYFKPGMENHPVVNTNWYEAMEYAAWIGKRLPTEAEWEKAARGEDARKFPWGNVWDDFATSSTKLGKIGSHPGRISIYGVMDMIGTIYEWTYDWYRPYPYKGPYDEGRIKTIRGGRSQFATCSYRGFDQPGNRNPQRGFRCALEC